MYFRIHFSHPFISLLLLFLFPIPILSANSANFDAANALSGNVFEPGQIYAFKHGGLIKGTVPIGHVRLLVVWVMTVAGDLDITTISYEQTWLDVTSAKDLFFGPVCGSHAEVWRVPFDVKDKNDYKFLGKVQQGVRPGALKRVVMSVDDGPRRFNLLTNNCNTFVNKLYKQIKARDLAERVLLDRDIDRYSNPGMEFETQDIEEYHGLGLEKRDMDYLDDVMDLYLRAEDERNARLLLRHDAYQYHELL